MSGLQTIAVDVFDFDLDVVMHQANCKNTMGSGIAGFIKKRYPEAYRADTALDMSLGEVRLGHFTWSWVDQNKFRIVNLYGQDNYAGRDAFGNYSGNFTQVWALEKATRSFLDSIKDSEDLTKLRIGVPYKIGCDRAGGDWDEVSKMFDTIAKDYGITIFACWKR